MKLFRPLFLLSIILLLAACSPEPATPPPIPTNTPLPPTEAAPSNTPTPAPVEHRIGVRVVDGGGEFYDRITGEAFVPRGNNYVRLDPQPRPDGGSQVYHSVFDPAYFDPAEITAAFEEMQTMGYNSVRVFISQNTIVTSRELDDGYMQNVIEFLQIAKAYGQYVIFTLDWVPGGKYGEILSADCCEQFNMFNANTLPQAGLEANKVLFSDFVSYLIDHQAPMDIIFSFQLRNELFYEMNFPPLSLDSGMVLGANGETYDMSIPEDKTRMADEVMVFWINSLRETIIEIDPTALVSVGFFWPQEPNPARVGDPRYINTAPAIWDTDLDFIDLHIYPGSGLTMAEMVENFGVNGMQEKPIVIGEFGTATADFPSVSNAAQVLMNWQAESCEYGFDGWLLWTWDIYENNDFYSAKSGEGQIGQALSPAMRPDPCQTADFAFIETNLALNKPVTASRQLPDQPAENLVDGSGAQWGAGAPPTQWVQIDLQTPARVSTIRLVVSQYPAGETVHQLWLGPSASELTLAHTFESSTQDLDTLTFEPDTPLENVQVVRVVTTVSPSWVSWKEIEVIAAP